MLKVLRAQRNQQRQDLDTTHKKKSKWTLNICKVISNQEMQIQTSIRDYCHPPGELKLKSWTISSVVRLRNKNSHLADRIYINEIYIHMHPCTFIRMFIVALLVIPILENIIIRINNTYCVLLHNEILHSILQLHNIHDSFI